MDRIYLDHASAMPIDPRVFNFAKDFLINEFGNPSSLYSLGLNAKEAIEEARSKVSRLINAENDKSIIFTGGATEANNLGIRGTALRNVKEGKELVASSINYCYWYGSPTIRPNGVSSTSMYDDVEEAFKDADNHALNFSSRIGFLIKILSEHRYPLLEERKRHLLELCEGRKAED